MIDRRDLVLAMLEGSKKKSRTLEGIPPLTFKGYGKNLENYRIYMKLLKEYTVYD